jgi:hypothetical protein
MWGDRILEEVPTFWKKIRKSRDGGIIIKKII